MERNPQSLGHLYALNEERDFLTAPHSTDVHVAITEAERIDPWGLSDEEAQRVSSDYIARQAGANQSRSWAQVSEQSRLEAARRMNGASDAVRAIIDEHAARHGVNRDLDKVDLVRSDHDVRRDLFDHFVDVEMNNARKYDPGAIPDRRGAKTPNHPGYEWLLSKVDLSSEAYAALIGIAMVSGEFVKPPAGDEIEIRNGNRLGQHRYLGELMVRGIVDNASIVEQAAVRKKPR